MANNAKQSFSENREFDDAIRKLVAVPKSEIEQREAKWKAARKKRKRLK